MSQGVTAHDLPVCGRHLPYTVEFDPLSRPDRLPCTQYNEITKQCNINFSVLNKGSCPRDSGALENIDSGDKTKLMAAPKSGVNLDRNASKSWKQSPWSDPTPFFVRPVH